MQLTIITINYNNVEGLCKTIKSVVSQTWHDFEWIIIDGDSSDGSRELIEETAVRLSREEWLVTQFSSHDALPELIATTSRFHHLLWCSESDKGIYNAMNKGILRATGEYCLFLNSGDWLCNSKVLDKAFKLGIDKDIVSFDQLKDLPGGKMEYISKVESSTLTGACLMTGTLPHQATFIRRKLFMEFGLYDETLKIVSDWKFFLETLLFQEVSFCHHALPFSYIQLEGISLVNDVEREQERLLVLEKYFPKLVIEDYSRVHSLSYVIGASWLCRRLYGLLFRLADLTYKFK